MVSLEADLSVAMHEMDEEVEQEVRPANLIGANALNQRQDALVARHTDGKLVQDAHQAFFDSVGRTHLAHIDQFGERAEDGTMKEEGLTRLSRESQMLLACSTRT